MDLTLSPGEIVGLPGPSGSGKTTLARILAGYLRPDEGKVRLAGSSLPRGTFCPVQLLFQHPELTVNPRWKIGTIIAEAQPVAPFLLDALTIDKKWLGRYPHELSGGELQRVCLARALAGDVRYLLCDEMTSMLDALSQAMIWQAVVHIARERNLGLLVISHDEDLLSRLCHRRLDPFLQGDMLALPSGYKR
jgi:peptide/nickel transport system ATP-binding protein